MPKDQVRHRDSRRKNDRVALELRSYLHSNSLSGNSRRMNYFSITPTSQKQFSVQETAFAMNIDCVPLAGNLKEQKGMVLPFQPLSMCFRNINYYVDVPVVRQSWIICNEVSQKKSMYLFIHNPVLLAGIKKARCSRRPPAAAC